MYNAVTTFKTIYISSYCILKGTPIAQ